MTNETNAIPEYVNNALLMAYEQAQLALQSDEVPIGAVIVNNKEIIASNHNRIKEKRDPSAHAELLVIQQAAKIINNERLVDCELFTTLEPCVMCTGAIILSRIPVVYFLAYDQKLPAMRSILSFENHNFYPIIKYMGNPDIPAGETLKTFFRNKRESKTSSKII